MFISIYRKSVTFCLIIVTAGILKLAFHHNSILTKWLPESCVLIFIGLVFGFIIYGAEDPSTSTSAFPRFTTSLFFNVLLPPIILDSAYSLYDRAFLDNLGSIMVFAIIGTVFNVFTVAGSLYFVNYIGKSTKI